MDCAGSDAGTGTLPSSAWRTLAKVNSSTLLPGDTIYLRRGCVWRETLAPGKGGAPAKPITFTGYGEGVKPVISGSDLIIGWSGVGNSIYEASCPSQPNNVYVDGGPGWGLTASKSIESMIPGSWFWDGSSKSLYLRVADDAGPSRHRIEAAVRVYGMKVVANGSEKSNVVVDGLAFERTGGYGIFFYSNADGGEGLSGIVIKNNRVAQTGTGTDDRGEYYNAIHFSEHLPLDTAPQFINNSISYSGGHGNAINSQNANGAQLISNHADHFNHHAFDTKNSSAVIIRGNTAHDSAESNGIYQEYCSNGLIEQNLVYNLSGSVPGRGSGVQIDVGSSGARILRNTIHDVLTGIYLNVPATVSSNAVIGARHAALEANAGGIFDHNNWGVSSILFIDGRRFSSSEWTATKQGQNDSVCDPGWSNPGAGDFGVQAPSNCRPPLVNTVH